MTKAIIFNELYPTLLMENETAGIHLINADSSALFENVFKTYFKNLHSYAISILKDETTAEEMVQQVFYKLWEKKEQIQIQQSIKAYLYKAVYYECLNHIKHAKVKAHYAMQSAYHRKSAEKTNDHVINKELSQRIDKAINELPEQCRTIFQLSRFEELKYREIAAQLGISEKKVENQMGKALRLLRSKLAEFLP